MEHNVTKTQRMNIHVHLTLEMGSHFCFPPDLNHFYFFMISLLEGDPLAPSHWFYSLHKIILFPLVPLLIREIFPLWHHHSIHYPIFCVELTWESVQVHLHLWKLTTANHFLSHLFPTQHYYCEGEIQKAYHVCHLKQFISFSETLKCLNINFQNSPTSRILRIDVQTS